MAQLSITQSAIVAYVEDHPGCSRGEVATATSFGQGVSTIRERMRTVSLLLERGLLTDRNARAKNPGQSARLYTTAAGRRALAA